MKLKNKTELMIIIGVVISIIFAFIKWSISLGIIVGFIFSYVNYKMVYKSLDDVVTAQNSGKVKVNIGNQLLRFALLLVFVYITVRYPSIFHIAGVGIGLVLALLGAVLDTRKKVDNG